MVKCMVEGNANLKGGDVVYAARYGYPEALRAVVPLQLLCGDATQLYGTLTLLHTESRTHKHTHTQANKHRIAAGIHKK